MNDAGRSLSPLDASLEQNLDPDEVRVLWSFIHGDIMNAQTRARLREHRGLCSRHSWAYAIVEIELWESGAGARGGHQPFDVSILYTDLLQHMGQSLHQARHHRGRVKALSRRGSCLVCDDIFGPDLTGIVVTHGGFTIATLTAEANEMRYTHAWLAETAAHWSASMCPRCVAETGRTAGEGPLCRQHLLADDATSEESIQATIGHLDELHGRLHALTESMTQSGQPSTSTIDASWIETLAWFDGWTCPLKSIATPEGRPEP